MKFSLQKEELLRILRKINVVLHKNSSLSILENVLIEVKDHRLMLVSSNSESEIVSCTQLTHDHQSGSTTVSLRKIFQICRCLPKESNVSFRLHRHQMLICSEKIRFRLSTVPSQDFPRTPNWIVEHTLIVLQNDLKNAILSICFAMANTDIRYFLNGMLFEIENGQLNFVATDGHRLAISSIVAENDVSQHSVILPRNSVMELVRILDETNDPVTLGMGKQHIKIKFAGCVFTSKVIDGIFPKYSNVLPQHPRYIFESDCLPLKQAFSRIAILAHKTLGGVRMHLTKNQLTISAHNSEQEHSKETLDVFYQGEDFKVSFNVHYILDVLNSIKKGSVRFCFIDSISSVKIQSCGDASRIYIVMPMQL